MAKIERVPCQAVRSPKAQGILAALHSGIPFPCAVFDARGRPLWFSRAVEGLVRNASGSVQPLRLDLLTTLRGWSDAITQFLTGHIEDRTERQEASDITIRRFQVPPSSTVYLVVGSSNSKIRIAHLTLREREIADLAGQGFSASNIAPRLGIREGTVRIHLKNIYRKLRISSRVELARAVWAGQGKPPTSEGLTEHGL